MNAAPSIDLRSDTVTRPTDSMREAMLSAPVGDDVFGDDPTVTQLEHRLAEMLGMEAAIYMPSGTMTNQVAVRLHCQPGDEFLCERGCHIYNHEQGGFAQLSGVVANPIEGDAGVLQPEQLEPQVRPFDDHMVRTRLVCLENTHNRGGGRVQPFGNVERISNWARSSGLAMHLDGARLFNAVVASGVDAAQWAALFDTVSICFSKGLGAPVGSGLAGPHELITKARRHRKLFGGGMRQCGIVAAGALFALENHVQRLAEDHQKAQHLADVVRTTDGLSLTHSQVETNILFVDLDPPLGTGADFAGDLLDRGIGVLVEGGQRIRLLTHLDVTFEQVTEAGRVMAELATRRLENAS